LFSSVISGFGAVVGQIMKGTEKWTIAVPGDGAFSLLSMYTVGGVALQGSRAGGRFRKKLEAAASA
jgi:hypothetical protein